MMRRDGGCLCGGVRYQVQGELRPVMYCHCDQCRKTSGHFVAATACSPDQLTFVEDGGLTWFRSSDIAERGFCSRCGSNLFWQPDHHRHMSIMAGTLDNSEGLAASAHIYVKDAACYTTLSDGLRCFDELAPTGFEDATR